MDRHQKGSPATVFYVYAREDEPLRDELSKHLKSLVRQELIQEWYDQQIPAGTDRTSTIDGYFQDASIILLLVSPDFLASDYCYSIEVQRALERHHAGKAYVIPILLRPVDWQDTPFADLQCLPREGKPVTSWSNRDDAFFAVARGIRTVIENLELSTPQRSSSLLPSIWNIPYPRNPFFTGRDDLLTSLATALRTGQAAALMQAQAISGLGGIGKTQIAVEYAYRHRSSYQAVLWMQSDTRDNLISSFIKVAVLLDLPTKREKDQNIVIQSVMQWLRAHKDWLLILDNADDLELAHEFIPTTFTGHLILTTRAQAMGQLAQKIIVKVMPSEEGVLLLLRRAGIIGYQAGLDDASEGELKVAIALVQELGGLPLALDQAGAYIEEVECGISEYLQEYQRRRATLLSRRGGFMKDHPASVAATWSLSFEKIEQKNPTAADLLHLCAFLAPDGIPEEMVTQGAKHLGPHLQAIAEDRGKLDEAIRVLRTYSLIRRNSKNKLLSVHRLVQAVISDKMDKIMYQMWAERAVLIVGEAFPYPDFAVWTQCERYIDNAQSSITLIEQQSIIQLNTIRLLSNVGVYLTERGRYAEAEPILKQAHFIQEQQLGPEHLDAVPILDALGTVYSMHGKYTEAETFLKRALAIVDSQLGPDHLATMTRIHSLAHFYHDWRKYREAEPLLRRTLAIREQRLGHEHLDTATNMNELGGLYRKQGKYAEAEPLLRQALAIRQQQLSPEHPEVAESLNGLGQLHKMQGNYTEAEPLLQRALQIRERQLGPKHYLTVSSLNNLGNLRREQGRYAEAELLLKRTLLIREQEPDPLSTAMSLGSLARLYLLQERYAEAEPLYVRALAINEQILGFEHPDTLYIVKDYSDLLRKMHRSTEAELLEARFSPSQNERH